ncbi:hypothetical protein NESM_000164200 [Novymonas esmeraldas]|uniref:Uncharacterized protein n=1 Tax=Novymonas esmeraldas TaxID=1808958 RepID=A0AAW0F7F4_9TRYP
MRATHGLQGIRMQSFLFARRGHGGAAQRQKELERLAVLEESVVQPVSDRVQQVPERTSATAAGYVRGLAKRVECLRDAVAVNSASCGITSDEASAPQVTTLSQFLSTCKDHRLRYSSSCDRASRLQGRKELSVFWRQHAGSAIACCFGSVHDLGFVADVGLMDTGLHLDLRGLQRMLQILRAERDVASRVDTTRILAYLAREVQYLERCCNEKDTPVEEALTASNLRAFREAVTDVAVERLASFFLPQGPLKSIVAVAGSADGRSGSPSSATVPQRVAASAPASGLDALWGLEVLSCLDVGDAADEVVAHVWNVKQARLLRRGREPAHVRAALPTVDMAVGSASAGGLAKEVQYLLVAELFRVVAGRRHDLRMTDVVRGYALLRVHMRLLWPPYGQPLSSSPARGGSRAASQLSTAMFAPHDRLSLWYEKDSLFRVTWGLAIALASKDRVFVSSYHFVKIVVTLARLPAFLLAPEAHVTNTPRSPDTRRTGTRPVEVGVAAEEVGHTAARCVSATIAAEVMREQMATEAPPSTAPTMRAIDFWRFMIAKACVFIPSLPPEQRRIVCRSLHIAVAEKRAELLPLDTTVGAATARHLRSSSSSSRKRGFAHFRWTLASSRDNSEATATAILQPLVDEMAKYPETYEMCIASRPPPRMPPRRSAKSLSLSKK